MTAHCSADGFFKTGAIPATSGLPPLFFLLKGEKHASFLYKLSNFAYSLDKKMFLW